VQTCLTNPALCNPGLLIAAGVAQVKGNVALLRVRCAGEPGARCRGLAKLVARVGAGRKKRSVLVGRARFNLPTGGARVVRAKLTGRGLKLVRRSGRLG